MICNVRTDVREYVTNLVVKNARFNVQTYEYDPVSDADKWSLESVEVIKGCLINAEVVRVYMCDGAEVDCLEGAKGVQKKRGFYLVGSSALGESVIDTLLNQEEDEPMRGSVVIESTLNNVDWKGLLSVVYDPGYIGSLKYVMTPAASNYAKKRVSSLDDSICIVLSESGVDTISLYAPPESIEMLLEYAYGHSRCSEKFRSAYC